MANVGHIGLMPEFVAGVDDFVDYAVTLEPFQLDVLVKCPCSKCKCRNYEKSAIVKLHLYRNGFKEDYTVWTSHGEVENSFVRSQNYVAGGSCGAVEADVQNYRMHDMIRDVYGMHSDFESDDHVKEAPNDESKRFFEQLKALVGLYSTFKQMHKIGKKARASLKGGSLHTSGAQSLGNVRRKLEQARLAVLDTAQVHQQNIDNPRRAADPDDEDLGDDELLNPRRGAEVAIPANIRDRQARFQPEHRDVQIPFDDDDDNDLDGAGATGAIIPPPLAPRAKLNITSTMIQLLQLKGLFGGLAVDDSNMDLVNFISTCKSFDNPGVGQNVIRLRLFPLSLSGEATLWLNGLTPDSITNWRQLKDVFLERFFPPSKRAQLRDEINNFCQHPTEALHETWERFKKKLMRCPNHHMTNVHLMEILYRSLNSVTKPVVDKAAGGSFMDLTFVQASDMLDRMTKQSRAWHTMDSEVTSPTVSIGMTTEQRRREEERDQDMAHMKTQMDLLTKHLLSGKTEKVKVVASKEREESDSEEEANYLNNQGGFRGTAQGNQGRNYYDKSGNKDRDQGSWKNKTDRSGLYIPPRSHDTAASGFGKMSMEYMMAKLLKGVEATSKGATEVINDLASMKQLVDSHSTSIRQLEQQLSQILATLNQRKADTLPSDTVQNPTNDGTCLAITTRSGKVLEISSKGTQAINAESENAVEAEKGINDITPQRPQPEKSASPKQDEKKVVEKTIPLPPPPFPQRLKKRVDDISSINS
ncbi:hypothetical protein CQW23_14545 [Capsicum baccatum]|uniref:Transposase-associated domain-containing protein n=1 Tax=Capsicum baccatum TaxID=33114 RepID=A0A2G2WJG1_CAPBA|nr:hypothetical protein CQW23_14545 [Capsicum baccatum]